MQPSYWFQGITARRAANRNLLKEDYQGVNMKQRAKVLSTLLVLLLVVTMVGCASGSSWTANGGGATSTGGRGSATGSEGGGSTGEGSGGTGSATNGGEGGGTGSATNGGEGGGTTATESPIELEIIEYGYTVDDHGYVYYAIGIRNPNSDYMARQYSVTFTGRNADGSILFSEDDYRGSIYPKEEQYYASIASGDAKPAKVEVEVYVDKRNWAKAAVGDNPEYEITNVSEVTSRYSTRYTGEIQALSENGEGSVRVSVIYRDSKGEIITGASSYINNVKSDRSIPFDISVYNPPDNYASYELKAIWQF